MQKHLLTLKGSYQVLIRFLVTWVLSLSVRARYDAECELRAQQGYAETISANFLVVIGNIELKIEKNDWVSKNYLVKLNKQSR